jgi:hypothetical protein
MRRRERVRILAQRRQPGVPQERPVIRDDFANQDHRHMVPAAGDASQLSFRGR